MDTTAFPEGFRLIQISLYIILGDLAFTLYVMLPLSNLIMFIYSLVSELRASIDSGQPG